MNIGIILNRGVSKNIYITSNAVYIEFAKAPIEILFIQEFAQIGISLPWTAFKEAYCLHGEMTIEDAKAAINDLNDTYTEGFMHRSGLVGQLREQYLSTSSMAFPPVVNNHQLENIYLAKPSGITLRRLSISDRLSLSDFSLPVTNDLEYEDGVIIRKNCIHEVLIENADNPFIELNSKKIWIQHAAVKYLSNISRVTVINKIALDKTWISADRHPTFKGAADKISILNKDLARKFEKTIFNIASNITNNGQPHALSVLIKNQMMFKALQLARELINSGIKVAKINTSEIWFEE
jgi:hypothetical protein